MRMNTNDLTIVKNYLSKYKFLVSEYELVKKKEHPSYRYVKDFYNAHNIDRRHFIKFYNRFKLSGNVDDLLPQKRGPKYKTRRIAGFIEEKIIKLRMTGRNKYEIVNSLKPLLKQKTPSPSGVYKVLKRHKINRLKPKMKENKRRIIKEKAGELAHIDSHYLRKGIIDTNNNRYYLVGVIDSCTRLCWVEIVKDIKSLSAMFATLKCFNMLARDYNVKFAEVLTDNGPEFGIKTSSKKAFHPFERMLIEMEIKHRYIRPYRPQTNGKIERFWRTIEEDLFEETSFDNFELMQDELLQYMVYYNEERPHQALGGISPSEFNKKCPRIT